MCACAWRSWLDSLALYLVTCVERVKVLWSILLLTYEGKMVWLLFIYCLTLSLSWRLTLHTQLLWRRLCHLPTPRISRHTVTSHRTLLYQYLDWYLWAAHQVRPHLHRRDV
ncbi:hypothetical protein QBC47DRAFT_376600 [Echria macrotheca]|uniref:Uncharacterized protein n=1 Tax=Echria macrotheca TaxID=438768 RepID=A0AAJ0BG50_9PEZI|nr:hypothetical protein QBC47DRAFT_376600 [Echria macrotheca]